MADALVMFDHWHLRAFRDSANQAFATAWHTEIDKLSEREQLFDRFTVSRGHYLDGVLGKLWPTPASRRYHYFCDGSI